MDDYSIDQPKKCFNDPQFINENTKSLQWLYKNWYCMRDIKQNPIPLKDTAGHNLQPCASYLDSSGDPNNPNCCFLPLGYGICTSTTGGEAETTACKGLGRHDKCKGGATVGGTRVGCQWVPGNMVGNPCSDLCSQINVKNTGSSSSPVYLPYTGSPEQNSDTVSYCLDETGPGWSVTSGNCICSKTPPPPPGPKPPPPGPKPPPPGPTPPGPTPPGPTPPGPKPPSSQMPLIIGISGGIILLLLMGAGTMYYQKNKSSKMSSSISHFTHVSS
jgi:hypothetical protein